METDLIKSLRNRYAVKKFDPDRKLTGGLLNEILEAARLTATSYGLQLMKLVIVEDQEVRKQLLASSYNQKQVVDASHLLVLCRERSFQQHLIEGYIANISETRNIAVESLLGFNAIMSNWLNGLTADEQRSWMEKQVYIVMGNLLTTCAVLGVGSCPMEGFINEEYDQILGLENENLASVLVLPIGYGTVNDPNAKNKKVRRSEPQFIVRV